jgi:poly-gamma-glutamate synthesis protein (capsule biosynthesis protein)
MEQSRRDRRRHDVRRRRVLVGLVGAGLVVGGVITAGAVLRDDPTRSTLSDRLDAPAFTDPVDTTPITEPVPPPSTRGPRGSGEPVTFAFGGDVHFEGGLRARLGDPASALSSIAPVLSAADVAVVNLESAITEGGVAAAKEFVFRAPASALDALVAAGVDTASVANNHGMDYGPEGLQDTLAAEQASGFDLIGAGQNATEAYAPHRMEVKGQRIAIIGATQVLDDAFIASWTATADQPGLASAKEVDRLLEAVTAARADTDTLVVYLHWGIEGQTCPSPAQQTLAQQLVDAGADIVVGGHAHRLMGAGRLGPALVAYGLGNFVFYNEAGPSGESGVLQVTATGREIDAYDWTPARIVGGTPQPLDGAAAETARAAWDALRECTGLTP